MWSHQNHWKTDTLGLWQNLALIKKKTKFFFNKKLFWKPNEVLKWSFLCRIQTFFRKKKHKYSFHFMPVWKSCNSTDQVRQEFSTIQAKRNSATHWLVSGDQKIKLLIKGPKRFENMRRCDWLQELLHRLSIKILFESKQVPATELHFWTINLPIMQIWPFCDYGLRFEQKTKRKWTTYHQHCFIFKTLKTFICETWLLRRLLFILFRPSGMFAKLPLLQRENEQQIPANYLRKVVSDRFHCTARLCDDVTKCKF